VLVDPLPQGQSIHSSQGLLRGFTFMVDLDTHIQPDTSLAMSLHSLLEVIACQRSFHQHEAVEGSRGRFSIHFLEGFAKGNESSAWQ